MRNIEDASIYIILHQLVHLSKYQAMKWMENLELKPSQAGILFALNSDGKLSQRELAEKIGITPPSMTVALKKLEEKGFILKEPDEKDQRIIRICLADKGKSCVDDIKRVTDDMEKVIYQGITQEERMLFRRLLLQMRQNLLDSKDFKDVDMGCVLEKVHAPMKSRF